VLEQCFAEHFASLYISIKVRHELLIVADDKQPNYGKYYVSYEQPVYE
jgi:hypothetical protein